MVTSSLLSLSLLSRGFSTGAPSSVCESMMPRHSGVLPQSSTAPYTIETGTSTYQPGIPKQVQILGPQYRGFILEARKDRSTTPLGSWQDPPENTKLLQCFGNLGAAVTHSSTAPKNSSTTFVWIPPESACPDAVTFTATVAQSREIYWLNVQSPSLTKGIACCAVKMVYGISIITTLFLCSLMITGCQN
ncbi:putative defense protein Hdd11-like isoform X3 [Scyliorhinus canicula]|uniref:putative defense protein Hdd11-like isoform X3 n=1 Tax=Scyliorhinus canicula TaxID=7830 RepID=UPI0018F5B0B3|nr:putative defense protein Hdd11-like isoform X3 [Scyliorhinus canicula]